MILVHLVEIKRLSSKPVSFSFHAYQTRLLLRFDSFHVCFLFQIAHILLNYVHLLLECLQKVILVLIHDLFYELSRILIK